MNDSTREAARHFEELYRTDADPWRYAERGAELHRHELVAEVAARVPHGRILEVGCSAGALTARLAALGGGVVSFDLSAVAVARAREVVASRAPPPASACAFLIASVAALPFREGAFDLVVAADGPIEWRLDRAEVYRRMHASLAPGGHVLFTEYLRANRFSGFVAEVSESPLRVVEVRHLHDRPWYGLERRLQGVARFGAVRRFLGKVEPARVLDRVGALFGPRTASHILVLAARD